SRRSAKSFSFRRWSVGKTTPFVASVWMFQLPMMRSACAGQATMMKANVAILLASDVDIGDLQTPWSYPYMFSRFHARVTRKLKWPACRTTIEVGIYLRRGARGRPRRGAD